MKSVSKTVEQFYDENSDSWSSKRQYSWQGWDEVWKLIDSKLGEEEINILDLGCGNGRLYKYYSEKLKNRFDYLGLDISQGLLNIANGSSGNNAKYLKCDLTDVEVLRKLLIGENKKYKIINVYAVLHHIPKQSQRVEIIKIASEYLVEEGFLIFTTWEFLDNDKTKKLIKEDLENGDYMLGWDNSDSRRFAHSFSDKEKEGLIQNSKLKLVSDFKADGKNGKLNHYFILKR